MYRLEGYDSYINTRENTRGGGVLLYVKKKYNFTSQLIKYNYCEGLHGQLMQNGKVLHIFIVYRPPKTNKIGFLQEIHQLLSSVPATCEVLFLGDTNINLLSETGSGNVISAYSNNMSEVGMHCAIRDVTREEVYGNSVTRTCIDHAWVRSPRTTSSYVITSKLSDHYPIGLSLANISECDGTGKQTCLTRICDNKVAEELASVSWTELMDCECPLELYDRLCAIFSCIYNKSETKISIRKKRQNKPWINKKIKCMISLRDKLFKKWKTKPSDMNLRLQYNRYRNRVNKYIFRAKNTYRKEEILKCKKNIRNIWSKINTWTGREKLGGDATILRYLGKIEATEVICNKFSETFTKEILSIKHDCNNKFLVRSQYIKTSEVSLRFTKACPEAIAEIINSLSADKSPGLDKIRIKDIKLVKQDISKVLALFINLCVEKGVYPNTLEAALIRPIYKQGSHCEYSNYRPIAILSVVNKIVEKYVVEQISAFLERNSIISNAQHGFRRGRSTTTALAQFADDVNECLGQRKQVVVVYIDFKKAFDTLGHHQLLQAMEECGIAGPLNRWLRAYLTGRTLQTVVDGVRGTPALVECGVPTGSVFGPVGYVMHVNSMCNVVHNCNIYMYADDTCLLYADKDLTVIENKIQEDFTNIIKWAHDNGIVININKTKCMHVRSPYSRQVNRPPRIIGHTYECLHSALHNCECECIEVVSEYRYLGLLIDYNFSWKSHVNKLCEKLRIVLVKLHQLKYVLDRATMFTLYYALANSLLSYGLTCYGRTFKTYLDRIKSLQIRFMKLLVDKKTKTRCKKSDYEELFVECRMLPVHEEVGMLLALEQFNKDEFKNYINRPRLTRTISKKMLEVPSCRNNYYGKRSRKYLVPKLYNEIPYDIRECKSFRMFKCKLKTYLLNKIKLPPQ